MQAARVKPSTLDSKDAYAELIKQALVSGHRQAVLGEIESRSHYYRDIALKALAQQDQGPTAIPVLLKYARDPDWRVQITAIIALEDRFIANSAVMSELAHACGDPDEELSGIARDALSRVVAAMLDALSKEEAAARAAGDPHRAARFHRAQIGIRDIIDPDKRGVYTPRR